MIGTSYSPRLGLGLGLASVLLVGCAPAPEQACARLEALASAQGEGEAYDEEQCLERMDVRRRRLGSRRWRHHVRCLERADNLAQAGAC